MRNYKALLLKARDLILAVADVVDRTILVLVVIVVAAFIGAMFTARYESDLNKLIVEKCAETSDPGQCVEEIRGSL